MKERYFNVSKKIYQWKFDTPFENWLAYKADKSEFWKKLYLLYYRVRDAKYYRAGYEMANKVIDKYVPYSILKIESEAQRKVLLYDMIYSLHRFGASFEEYFIFEFYNKNTFGRESFNTLKMHYGYCDIANKDNIREIFEDKGKSYEIFKDFYKRELIVFNNKTQLEDFDEFIKRHGSFIIKPYNGHSGMGIHIVRSISEKDAVALFYKQLALGPFVVEELIEQGDEMAKLHPQSINTLRIVTFKTKEDIRIIGSSIRIGVGGANVDNAGAGGIYASIDYTHGFINSVAFNYLGEMYSIHPDTKIPIPGFHIPEWNEVVKLVTNLAKVIDGATMISWDLAYGKKGWLMIEGNDVGGASTYQAPYQRGRKHIILDLLDEYIREQN